ncbi:MAG: ribbon-helix-helix domain-containing protein [Candidatus Heimdallarchaeota archaeon]|nr:ribbon-helix-helix domain-containing protein [Candidatus Heimdallarchaeota archaeon]MDH5646960.1 ribbon-helix-helix domain-containing protein [Candidatus Heimdallarchaeota archaeon]
MVRITFSCDDELKDKLSNRAKDQGIPRGQLIIELLEYALSKEESGKPRDATVDRFMFDLQQRIADIETWRREINVWAKRSEENSNNLETTIANLLNEQVTDSDFGEEFGSKNPIPAPKRRM